MNASTVFGASAPMARVRDLIDRLSTSCCAVLLTGETGTGKEVVARAIHDRSPRATGPFVTVDCGALATSVMESELFGHRRGSFTGANETTDGLFQCGNHGTLFLDEVGEIPVPSQVKLLRTIQEKEIRRVGSTEYSKVDVRLIAATNRDLQDAMREGTFRRDLYYRLAVVEIELPPLRAHKSDIPMLVEHLVSRHAERNGPHPSFGGNVWRRLIAYDWPGNVRELENCILRSLALGIEPSPESIEPADWLSQALEPEELGTASGTAPVCSAESRLRSFSLPVGPSL